VSRPVIFLRYWLPVVLWAGLLFGMSTGAGASQHTSRFFKPFLRWLVPGISEETLDALHLGVRKTAHVTEYAIFATLWLRALRRPRDGAPPPWNWRVAAAVVGACAFVAAGDESWQSLFKDRTGAIADVALDTFGGASGVMLWWSVGRFRKRW
jgi:VanZ family protein